MRSHGGPSLAFCFPSLPLLDVCVCRFFHSVLGRSCDAHSRFCASCFSLAYGRAFWRVSVCRLTFLRFRCPSLARCRTFFVLVLRGWLAPCARRTGAVTLLPVCSRLAFLHVFVTRCVHSLTVWLAPCAWRIDAAVLPCVPFAFFSVARCVHSLVVWLAPCACRIEAALQPCVPFAFSPSVSLVSFAYRLFLRDMANAMPLDTPNTLTADLAIPLTSLYR